MADKEKLASVENCLVQRYNERGYLVEDEVIDCCIAVFLLYHFICINNSGTVHHTYAVAQICRTSKKVHSD